MSSRAQRKRDYAPRGCPAPGHSVRRTSAASLVQMSASHLRSSRIQRLARCPPYFGAHLCDRLHPLRVQAAGCSRDPPAECERGAFGPCRQAGEIHTPLPFSF